MSDFFEGTTWCAMLEDTQKRGSFPRNSPENRSIRMILLQRISECGGSASKILVLGWQKSFNSENAYLWAIFLKALRDAQCLKTHRNVVLFPETLRKIGAFEWFFSSGFQNVVAQPLKLWFWVGKNHSIPRTRIYERFFWRHYVMRNAWRHTKTWFFSQKLSGKSEHSNDSSPADFRMWWLSL